MARQVLTDRMRSLSNRMPGTCRWGGHRLPVRVLAVMLAMACLLALLAGCGRGGSKVLGNIDELAPVALVRYETPQNKTDFAGIVYREILDLPAFLASAKEPVLLIFHQPGDAVERQLIPMVEQFADDYQGKVSVVFIDAHTKSSLVALYGIETVPQYILVKSGSARLTMNGFDATTRAGLERMVQMTD